MPVSALSVDYDELLARCSFERHGVRSTSALAADEVSSLTDAIKDGLRKFYFPAAIDGTTHNWSFLDLRFTLATAANVDAYQMEPDFLGIDGGLHYDPNDASVQPIRKVPYDEILRLRTGRSTTTGYPSCFAERPNNTVGDVPQYWTLEFWPTPNATYTLYGRRAVVPQYLSSTQKYPLGSMEHAKVLVEACLSEIELLDKDANGVHAQMFDRYLKAAIERDIFDRTPRNMGYMQEKRAKHYGRKHSGASHGYTGFVGTIAGVEYTG